MRSEQTHHRRLQSGVFTFWRVRPRRCGFGLNLHNETDWRYGVFTPYIALDGVDPVQLQIAAVGSRLTDGESFQHQNDGDQRHREADGKRGAGQTQQIGQQDFAEIAPLLDRPLEPR